MTLTSRLHLSSGDDPASPFIQERLDIPKARSDGHDVHDSDILRNRQLDQVNFARALTKDGRTTYKLRGQTVEPVFGQIKHNRRCTRFSRRGFSACQSEWFLICGAHNLLKLWRVSKEARN